MDMQSILYLLELVSKMLPTGHTRQSLYLASLLTRITWSAESSSDVGPSVARANSPIQTILSASKKVCSNITVFVKYEDVFI